MKSHFSFKDYTTNVKDLDLTTILTFHSVSLTDFVPQLNIPKETMKREWGGGGNRLGKDVMDHRKIYLGRYGILWVANSSRERNNCKNTAKYLQGYPLSALHLQPLALQKCIELEVDSVHFRSQQTSLVTSPIITRPHLTLITPNSL